MVFGRYKKPVNIKNKQNGENKKQNKAQNISTRTLTPLSFKYTKDIDDHLNYLFPDRQTGLAAYRPKWSKISDRYKYYVSRI